jgi:predicted  nucleic acid-binding Zn ribbon protein
MVPRCRTRLRTARGAPGLNEGESSRSPSFEGTAWASSQHPKNGQIAYGTWMLVRREGRLEAFVRLAEPHSLETRHNNCYSTEALAALSPLVPDVEILGPVPESSTVCGCVSRSAMVLFTHYLSTDPPVRCLDCFELVPLYSLPHVHDREHLVLLHWASDYRACDTLQMHCTTGERFGEEQLSRHGSSARLLSAIAADAS